MSPGSPPPPQAGSNGGVLREGASGMETADGECQTVERGIDGRQGAALASRETQTQDASREGEEEEGDDLMVMVN